MGLAEGEWKIGRGPWDRITGHYVLLELSEEQLTSLSGLLGKLGISQVQLEKLGRITDPEVYGHVEQFLVDCTIDEYTRFMNTEEKKQDIERILGGIFVEPYEREVDDFIQLGPGFQLKALIDMQVSGIVPVKRETGISTDAID